MSIWRTWCACVCTLDRGWWTWVEMSTLQMSPFPPRRLHEPSPFKELNTGDQFSLVALAPPIYLQFTIRPHIIYNTATAYICIDSRTGTRALWRPNCPFEAKQGTIEFQLLWDDQLSDFGGKTGERRSCGNFRRRSAVQRWASGASLNPVSVWMEMAHIVLHCTQLYSIILNCTQLLYFALKRLFSSSPLDKIIKLSQLLNFHWFCNVIQFTILLTQLGQSTTKERNLDSFFRNHSLNSFFFGFGLLR